MSNLNRYYVYRRGEVGDTFDADFEPDALGLWVKAEDAMALNESNALLCESIAKDWFDVGQYGKAYAAEHIAAQIRGLKPKNHGALDEWALQKAREFVKRIEETNHPRAMLVSAVQSLLIAAMEYSPGNRTDQRTES